MKYVNRLSMEQINDFLKIFNYNKDIKNIVYYKYKDELIINFIEIEDDSTVEVSMKDYCIKKIKDYINGDIYGEVTSPEIIKQYRKKMLEYFGKQYAIDYLLGE